MPCPVAAGVEDVEERLAARGIVDKFAEPMFQERSILAFKVGVGSGRLGTITEPAPRTFKDVQEVNFALVLSAHAEGLNHGFPRRFRKVHARHHGAKRMSMAFFHQHDFGRRFSQALGGQRARPGGQR